MKNSIKTFLALGIVTVAGAGGTALVASARGDLPTTNQETRVAQMGDREANEESENEAEDASETEETSQYQALATITPAQAQQAAEANRKERATKVELDEEDGSLVYKVEFAKAEVLVDAGNGEILKTEIAGQEENDATETSVRGSIQLPEGAGEQGETQEGE